MKYTSKENAMVQQWLGEALKDVEQMRSALQAHRIKGMVKRRSGFRRFRILCKCGWKTKKCWTTTGVMVEFHKHRDEELA